MALADRLQEGRAAFNRGHYFAAHELWEAVWLQLSGSDRSAVQGLIQLAAGLHHLQGGRPGPAASLLRKGLAKLGPGLASAPIWGSLAPLRVEALVRQVAPLVDQLETGAGRMPDLGPLAL